MPCESREFVARHALDGLSPTNEVAVSLATLGQLDALADLAKTAIPGIRMSAGGLAAFLRRDPETIFVFQRNGAILGGVAFLYLNERGLDALILDAIDLKNPDPILLAGKDQDVAAMYTWALAGTGRAVLGLANVAAHHGRSRYRAADYYAQPSSKAGRALLMALNFQPEPSFQPELWRFGRSPPAHMMTPPPSYRLSGDHHVGV